MTGPGAASAEAQSFFLEERHDSGVVLLTMNRPERLNACSVEDHAEMSSVFRRLNRDPDVKVIVVTGAGRAFCIGGTFELLVATNRDHAQNVMVMNDARDLVHSLIDLDKVLISAVNGPAVGPGAIIALLSDYVIMEEGARLSDGHIKAALAAGDGGVIAWPLSIGLMQAKRFLLTGDWISAQDSLRLGLVTEIVDDRASVRRARVVASRFASGPQEAIRLTKRALNGWLRTAAQTYFESSLSMEALTMESDDFREALKDMPSGVFAMPPDHEAQSTLDDTPRQEPSR